MNFYRLELMKIRLSSYLWAIFGIFAGLLALGMLFLFILQIEAGESGRAENAELFANWNGLLALTTAVAFACFSVFSAVIAAKLIVNEYCGKNAVILLSYPIKRKAILRIKCWIVSSITVISAFISNTLVIGIMYISAHIFGIMPQMTTKYFVFTVLCSSFFMGMLSSAVGVISAAFGWKKRSIIAAIIGSLILVCILANCITISPSGIIWVMPIISIIFVIIASFIYHILANEIENMEV